MQRFRHRFQGVRRVNVRAVAIALLLIPFVLTALMPQGYMPGKTADGGFTVTLCTADGIRTVTLDAEGRERPAPAGPQDDQDRTHTPCVFAGIGAVLAAETVPEPAFPPPSPQPVPVWQETAWMPVGLGPLGARAPPHGS